MKMGEIYIFKKLKQVAHQIENSIIRISSKGVPHIVVNSYYSICYFRKTNIFRVWEGYATIENKKIKDFNNEDDLISFFMKMEK